MKFIAFFTSVISASYGLANFLRVGPMKIVPGSSVAHGTFFLAFASIATSFLARILILGMAFDPQSLINPTENPRGSPNMVLAVLVTFAPQLVLE